MARTLDQRIADLDRRIHALGLLLTQLEAEQAEFTTKNSACSTYLAAL